MPQYQKKFLAENINGKVLSELDEESLEELGVTRLHRIKLLREISKENL